MYVSAEASVRRSEKLRGTFRPPFAVKSVRTFFPRSTVGGCVPASRQRTANGLPALPHIMPYSLRRTYISIATSAAF
jgi:hypothetical protein